MGQVRNGGAHTGSVCFGLTNRADCATALESRHAIFESDQGDAARSRSGVGSVLKATTTRSAPMPLVMKIFEPSKIQSDPESVAWVRRPARSVPPEGSFIAIAVTSPTGTEAGSRRGVVLRS